MDNRKIFSKLAQIIFSKKMPEFSEFQVNEISGDSANAVFSISIDGENKFFLKIYDKEVRRAVAGKEKVIYHILDGKSDHVVSIVSHGVYENNEFIIVPFLKGIELLKVIEDKDTSSERLKSLSKQVFTFIEDCTQNTTEGYGSLNDDGVGSFIKWKEFIEKNINSMNESIDILIRSCGESHREFLLSVIESLKRFANVYEWYFDSVQSRLTPVDLNLCNFLVTGEGKLFAVDLESFVAGDPLIAYGELMGHIYNSPFEKYFSFLWDRWSDPQKNIVHFYALMCNLNVFVFCALQENRAPKGINLESICPWGNPNTFIELMSMHQKVIQKSLAHDALVKKGFLESPPDLHRSILAKWGFFGGALITVAVASVVAGAVMLTNALKNK